MLEPGPGNKKAFQSVIDAPMETRRAIRQAYFKIGKDHTDDLSRQMLARDKTGRIYILVGRTGRRRRHRASAPGQTAANITGNMRRNRGFQLKGSDQMEFGIRDTPYAAFLERGTSRMTARPSLGNTVKALQKNTTNYFARELGLKLKSR